MKNSKLLEQLITCFMLVLFTTGCSAFKPRLQSANSQAPADPNEQARAYAELAAGYLEMGQYEIAKSEIQKALTINPRSGIANNVYGLLLMEIGKLDEAEKFLRNANQIEPNNPNYQNNIALLYCQNNRATEGMRILSQALANKLYTRPQNSIMNAGICMEALGRPTDAEKYYRQALLYQDFRLSAKEKLAVLYYKNNRAQEAWNEINEIFSEFTPPSPKQYELIIAIATAVGKTDQAQMYKTKLFSDYPEYSEVKQLINEPNNKNNPSNEVYQSYQPQVVAPIQNQQHPYPSAQQYPQVQQQQYQQYPQVQQQQYQQYPQVQQQQYQQYPQVQQQQYQQYPQVQQQPAPIAPQYYQNYQGTPQQYLQQFNNTEYEQFNSQFPQ